MEKCFEKFSTKVLEKILQQHQLRRGARYLTGENLEVVWAEFSALS
jgi:hypothetical protein